MSGLSSFSDRKASMELTAAEKAQVSVGRRRLPIVWRQKLLHARQSRLSYLSLVDISFAV